MNLKPGDAVPTRRVITEDTMKRFIGLPKPLEEKEQQRILQTGLQKDADRAAIEQKTIHLALIDSADEDMAMSEIDFDEDIASLPVKEKMSAINEAYKKSLYFMKRVSELKEAYPRANFKPEFKTQVGKLMDKKNEIYSKPKTEKNYGAGGAVFDIIQKMQKNAGDVKKRKKEIQMFVEQNTEHVDDRVIPSLDALKRDEASLLELALVISTSPKSVKEARNDIAQLNMFVPENCTLKAISYLVQGQVNILAGKMDDIPYGGFKVSEVQAIAIKRGCKDVNDFINQVKSSIQYKNFTDMNRILKGDLQGNDFSTTHGIDDVIEKIHNRDAKEDIMEEGEYGIGIESSYDEDESFENNMDAEDEEAIMNDLQKVIKNRESPFMYPLVYRSSVSYKFLFHLVQQSKVILPYGKTLPDRTWTYIGYLLVDPNNEFKMRYDAERFILKIGGIGLLEKSRFFDKTTSVLFRRCFKSTAGNSEDINNMSAIMTGAYTGLSRLQAKKRMYFEMNDALESVKKQVVGKVASFEQLIKSNDLLTNHLFVEKRAKVSRIVEFLNTTGLASDRSSKEILSIMFDINIPENYRSIRQILEPLSYKSIYMARSMAKHAEMYSKGNEAGLDWFVLGLIMMLDSSANNFSQIVDMIEHGNDYIGVLDLLFDGKGELDKVKSAITQAYKITNESSNDVYVARVARFQSGVSNTYTEWARTSADSIIVDNAQVATLVRAGIQQEMKDYLEHNPIQEEKLLELDKVISYVYTDGTLITGNLFLQENPDNLRKRTWYGRQSIKINHIKTMDIDSWLSICSNNTVHELCRFAKSYYSQVSVHFYEGELISLLVRLGDKIFASNFKEVCKQRISENPDEHHTVCVELAKSALNSVCAYKGDVEDTIRAAIAILAIIIINL